MEMLKKYGLIAVVALLSVAVGKKLPFIKDWL